MITGVMVEVDRNNISDGVKESLNKCPIARALKEAGFRHVTVDTNTIEANDITFKTPRSACRFINAFDAGRKVKPFRFRMTLYN